MKYSDELKPWVGDKVIFPYGLNYYEGFIESYGEDKVIVKHRGDLVEKNIADIYFVPPPESKNIIGLFVDIILSIRFFMVGIGKLAVSFIRLDFEGVREMISGETETEFIKEIYRPLVTPPPDPRPSPKKNMVTMQIIDDIKPRPANPLPEPKMDI